MTRFLFFDTETDGLPKNYKAPVTDLDNWPRLVQIGWIVMNESQDVLEEKEYIIFPDGFIIPKEVSDIHRVTQERAEKGGVPILTVLQEFRTAISQSDYLVGHNIEFDCNIIGAEFIRNNIESLENKTPRICTMKSSTAFCKLPNKWGKYKWPKLMELHTKLFGEGFEEAHDAIADIQATAKCFFELLELKVISL